MAAGGFCKLPNGTVVVALHLPRPAAGGTGSVRVLVHAQNRARALTRLRNLGLRAVYLRGNAAPPTPDEITAVLHHPDGLIWRTAPAGDVAVPEPMPEPMPGPVSEPMPELWHPIRALLRRTAAPQGS
ncbi:hypothetical protein [Streptomyces mangrovisoli]|uniref:Uncharacterized protein n=1 Tax=Streptomyces mangrovisoli TaxID=1428628 RepID=A0A1J4P055_9ACTN|nr:hypothetical protein [Streptomyces mangrovisoli]OIJ67650.1 hypothetical protein WN71_012020 [Streptomyces mangrovisoli]